MLVHERARTGGSPRSSRRRLVVVAALGIAWTAAVAAVVAALDPSQRLWAWAFDHGYEETLNGRLRNELPRVPFVWAKAVVAGPPVPRLALDIGFRNIETLRAQRAAAVATGRLFEGKDDFVPAEIRIGGESVRARIRLKGDLTDHLEGGKWAFRVHVRDGGHVLGLRRFSLHHPRGRDYHGEPLFLDMARHEGVLAPRYFFADVVLNGDFIGRMAVEEHFSRELLESQGRREGVILKFAEEEFWQSDGELDNYAQAVVEPFQDADVAASAALSADLVTAIGLLRAFAQGRLPASEVFDAEQAGRFIALADAWGSWHALRWNNLRFYYNPITAHLEPIAFDAMVGEPVPVPERIAVRREPIVAALLTDSLVRASYLTALQRIVADLATPARRAALDSAQSAYLAVLARYYPLLRPFDFAQLRERADRVRRYQMSGETEGEAEHGHILHAYVLEDRAGRYLELASKVPDDVEVLGIEWGDGAGNRAVEVSPPAGLALPFVLEGSPLGTAPRFVRVGYLDGGGSDSLMPTIIARRKGQPAHVSVVARPYFPVLGHSPVEASAAAAVRRYHFLRADDDGRWVRVIPGRWSIPAPLILPPGVGLDVPPGTTLQFATRAALVVRGPTRLRGRPGAPVTLEPGAAGVGGGSWLGVVVLGGGAPSRWSHVVVRRTAGVGLDGWRTLTGGVTFYDTDLRVESSAFVGTLAEDALNLVRSRFILRDVAVRDVASDGLDIDFSDGTIAGGSFRDVGRSGGGDAVDVAGGVVSVTGTAFQRVGDKAISVGEGSVVTVRDVRIDDANAGAVSKDRSLLRVVRARMTDIRYAALMAYVKKPEYGPAFLEASGLRLERVRRPAVAQIGSSLLLEGERVRAEVLNVDSLYMTVMRRSSRQ